MGYTEKYLSLPTVPRWNQGYGLLYVDPTPPVNGVSQMLRWRPNVNQVCEPLLGTTTRQVDGGVIKAKYPKTKARHLLYREGLELVIVFRERADLFTLAMYRRQVTRRGDIPLDRLFYDVALTFDLAPDEWENLAIRMPRRSWIRRECERQMLGKVTPIFAIAAE